MTKEKAMDTPMIDGFCRSTDLFFQAGECGFARPCVGIMDVSSQCWVAYHDCEAAQNSRPADAYHKDDYLCVLVNDKDYNKAIEQLEEWMKKIQESKYRVVGKPGSASDLASLMAGCSVTQKALSDRLE